MAGSAWVTTTLGEVIELKRGYDLPSRERREGPYPIVSSSGISGYHAEAKVKAPGVVTGRYGTLGEVHYITEDYWPLNTSLYVRDFKANDPRFISYFLRSLDFRAYSDKAAVPGLNRNDLHTAVVRLPRVGEQRAIAHILGTLDDKIELNRRMNETLEAMAQALFKSWFVDFDPVRAKAEGRDPGLPKPLADLFPDSFEDSELGEIPKGWNLGSFLDCADLMSGGTPSTSVAEYWNGGIPWASAKDVARAKGSFLLETEKAISPLGVENSSTRVLPAFTTIITARGTVGTYCILGQPMAMNQTNYGLRAKGGVGDYFVFFSTGELVEHLRRQSYGTIFDTVTTKTFRDTLTVQPPSRLLDEFARLSEPIMSSALRNQEQSLTLAALRDTLLPMLISGELRLVDAERLAQEPA